MLAEKSKNETDEIRCEFGKGNILGTEQQTALKFDSIGLEQILCECLLTKKSKFVV